jgi:YfiH family protein
MSGSGLTIRREAGRFTVPLLEEGGYGASWTTREHDLAFEAPGRRTALRRLHIDPRRLVCPSQVHGERIAAVGRRQQGRGAGGRRTALPDTDALITDTPGTVLSVLTADCLPVFLAAAGSIFSCAAACGQAADRPARAAGLIHAGWRGLKRRIVFKTVRKMREAYGIPAVRLTAVLGPAIRPCCYEVGEEFLSAFPASASRRNGRFVLDLAAEATRQLISAGVSRNHIFDSRLCTYCSGGLLASRRRDGEEAGRSLSTLEIRELS